MAGLFGNEMTPKEIEAQVTQPQFMRSRAQFEQGLEETGRNVFDPLIEQATGYVSPTKQLRDIAAKADLNDESSIRATFNELLQRDPRSAAQWIKSIEPLIDKNKLTGANEPPRITELKQIGQLQFGCDVTKDRECFEKALQSYKETKRAGAEEQADAQYSTDQAKSFGELANEISGRADTAESELITANQSLAILNEGGVYFGPGADLVNYAKGIAGILGDTKSAIDAANAQQFVVNSMKSVMKWIAGTKGAISDKEMKYFADAAPSLSKTKEGNRLMLDTIVKLSNLELAIEDEFGRWREDIEATGKRPTVTQWKRHLRQWKQENGLDSVALWNQAKEIIGKTQNSATSKTSFKVGDFSIQVSED